jgi:hypothetical protein
VDVWDTSQKLYSVSVALLSQKLLLSDVVNVLPLGARGTLYCINKLDCYDSKRFGVILVCFVRGF